MCVGIGFLLGPTIGGFLYDVRKMFRVISLTLDYLCASVQRKLKIFFFCFFFHLFQLGGFKLPFFMLGLLFVSVIPLNMWLLPGEGQVITSSEGVEFLIIVHI
jgi:hypothetical protein